MILALLLLLGGCAPPAPEAPTEVAAGVVYTCPMHPSIHQDHPGSCPICGMTLTPIAKGDPAVHVDATRRARFGIAVTPAETRTLAETRALPAVVTWDADRVVEVSSRVAGWAKRVRGAPGARVAAGEALYAVYAPELVVAQADWLAAPAGPLRDATRQRLLRWGVAPATLDQIATSGAPLDDVPMLAPRGGVVLERGVVDGAAIGAGQSLYRIGDPSRVWVEVALPADVPVGVGQAVTVTAGAVTVPAAIDAILPEVDAVTRTVRARIGVDNPDGALRPDAWATVTVALPAAPQLAVPEAAVVYTGPRRLVFVDEGDDRLVPREVEVGRTVDGWVEILGGLKAGEPVVTAGTFLVAADARLREAAP